MARPGGDSARPLQPPCSCCARSSWCGRRWPDAVHRCYAWPRGSSRNPRRTFRQGKLLARWLIARADRPLAMHKLFSSVIAPLRTRRAYLSRATRMRLDTSHSAPTRPVRTPFKSVTLGTAPSERRSASRTAVACSSASRSRVTPPCARFGPICVIEPAAGPLYLVNRHPTVTGLPSVPNSDETPSL